MVAFFVWRHRRLSFVVEVVASNNAAGVLGLPDCGAGAPVAVGPEEIDSAIHNAHPACVGSGQFVHAFKLWAGARAKPWPAWVSPADALVLEAHVVHTSCTCTAVWSNPASSSMQQGTRGSHMYTVMLGRLAHAHRRPLQRMHAPAHLGKGGPDCADDGRGERRRSGTDRRRRCCAHLRQGGCMHNEADSQADQQADKSCHACTRVHKRFAHGAERHNAIHSQTPRRSAQCRRPQQQAAAPAAAPPAAGGSRACGGK